jgi:hypothetical protein
VSDKRKAILAAALVGVMAAGSLGAVRGSRVFEVATARADEVRVVANLKDWQHPVKEVLAKHKVILYKVELHHKTYPVFYVRFPYDPWFGHNDNYFKPLYYETLKANGFWDYSFIDQSFQCRINIKWDKKSKTLTESVDNLK